MKIHKPTLTIGIPACNEEVNIGNFLNNIFNQSTKNFNLVKIIIVSDGSTDSTIAIANECKKKFGKIEIIDNKIREGKAHALNMIYEFSNSDYLLTIDADVLFVGKKNLDLMTEAMQKDNSLNMVGPLHKPTLSREFFGNLSRFSFLIFRDAALNIDSGNNFYGAMSSEFMKKSFYKSFKFPKNTISDQCFAYAMSIKNGKEGFSLIQEAVIAFGVAQSFHDWRVLSARSVVGDKNDAVKHFGKAILDNYTMPKNLYIKSTINYFFKNPIYTIGAILMNIYIRKFPYKKHKPKNGVWEMVLTSKAVTI